MLELLTLGNFKSFSSTAAAKISDIVVLAGANSSGKTSIIQALLLLAQTLESPRREVALDLGGPLVQFAEFRDVVFGRPPNSQARFSVGFQLNVREPDPIRLLASDPSATVEALSRYRFGIIRPSSYLRGPSDSSSFRRTYAELVFGATRTGNPFVHALKLRKVFRVFEEELTIVHEIERSGKKYRVTSHTQRFSPSAEDDSSRQIPALQSEIAELKEVAPEMVSAGLSRHRTNLWILVSSVLSFYGLSWGDKVPEPMQAIRQDLISLKLPVGRAISPRLSAKVGKICTLAVGISQAFPVEATSILALGFDHFLPAPYTSYRELDPRTERYLGSFHVLFGEAILQLKKYLRSIVYVGPLRAKPERAYLPAGTPLDIGKSGENAVPILWVEQNDKVQTKTRPGAPPSRKRLGRAVQEWFEEFGIAQSLHVTRPKRVIYQAELEGPPASGTKVTIADVGFGVSQLLPVIVAGLRAPEGTTLIYEQPEIHLHPKLQAKLADFLLVMVELGKRVVVETHSEHLINSLRLRIAQDTTRTLQERVSILFVECTNPSDVKKHSEGPRAMAGSKISNLEVDIYGQIANWPVDFFPEYADTNEELLKAMLAKRGSESR